MACPPELAEKVATFPFKVTPKVATKEVSQGAPPVAVIVRQSESTQFCQLVVRQTSHTPGGNVWMGANWVLEVPSPKSQRNWVLKGSGEEEQLLKKKACGPATEGTKQACRLSHGSPCPSRSTSWQEVAKQVSWVKGSQVQTVRQAWKRVGPGYWWVMMGPKSEVPSPNSQK